MKTLEMLSEVKLSILALILLGIAELLVLDMGGNYVRMQNSQGSWLFIGATVAIGLLSAAIMGWSALKLRLEYRNLLTHGSYAGALVGASAAAGVCFFIVLLGLLGMGLEKLIPRSVNEQGLVIKATAYFLACFTIILIYGILGAVFGGMAGLASAPYHKHAPGKQAAIEDAGGKSQKKKPK